MLVKELIALLQELPQDSIVVISSDGEGNSFSPLSDIADNLLYEADSTWSGECHDPEEWAEDNYSDDDEEDGVEQEPCPGVPCVVLWPVN